MKYLSSVERIEEGKMLSIILETAILNNIVINRSKPGVKNLRRINHKKEALGTLTLQGFPKTSFYCKVKTPHHVGDFS
ncbi:hypothetical protein CN354_20035 [Bacillus cereus]|nr:hypothetical protein CN354_20035 [Bacillus cereus]WJE51074.1 hypothetical protein QRE66_17375 [Bacillus cereus]